MKNNISSVLALVFVSVYSNYVVAASPSIKSGEQENTLGNRTTETPTANDIEKELIALSSRIRISDSHEERIELKKRIAALLETQDGIESEQVSQISRALAITAGSPEGVVHSLSKTMYYIQGPSGYSVVMEKLTEENIKNWKEYVRTITHYFRISFPSKEDLSYCVTEEGYPDKWRKYLLTSEGLGFFKSRVEGFKKDTPYDIWVSYITCTNLNALLTEREHGQINEDSVEMIMSIQASNRCNVYSPMGISRTVAGAKKMLFMEESREKQEKKYLSSSIWLHLLSARIVKDLYPNIDTFFTTPIRNMRIILAQNLNPHICFRKPMVIQYGVEFESQYVEIPEDAKKATSFDKNKSIPWIFEFEFLGGGL